MGITCDGDLCTKTCSGIAYSWVEKGTSQWSSQHKFMVVGDTNTELDNHNNYKTVDCIKETSGKLTLQTTSYEWEGELQIQFLEVYLTEFVMAVEGTADDRNRRLFFKNK